MIKRLIDITISFFALIFSLPILLPVMFLVWGYDRQSPFYIASRVGKNGILFNMIKLRSMIIDANKLGIDSTSNDDRRVTPIGKVIRKYKLDELVQLWNVLLGDMSLVGPRPNVKPEVDIYTDVERNLLSVKPGITDFSSIVFSDEGKILEGKKDPDLSYNQLIRPWKSRLGLIYIKFQSLTLDFEIIIYTIISLFSRSIALRKVCEKLDKLGANQLIIDVAKRENELYAYPPPGSDHVVSKR